MNLTDPVSYGADKGLVGIWLALCAAPVPSCLLGVFGQPALWTPLLVVLLPPIALLIFVSRFRAVYAADRFIYQRWGSTIDVAYDDIAAIEVTNHAPLAQVAIGAFLVTRAGARLPFWPVLFPRSAVKRFFELAPIRVQAAAANLQHR